MLYLILEIKFSRKSDFISVFTFKSNARETWCVILVSESWHILLRITALYTSFRSAQNHCLPDNVRPRGAFISVGDWTPTEKDLLLLTICRSGSLNSDWDKKCHTTVQEYCRVAKGLTRGKSTNYFGIYFLINKLWPVISSGCFNPISSINVGAISARHPPSASP